MRACSQRAPPLLDRVLARCLQKDREERWQSARDIKAAIDLIALEPAENQIATQPIRNGIWPAAAAAAAGAAFLEGRNWPGNGRKHRARWCDSRFPCNPATGLRPIAAIAPDGHPNFAQKSLIYICYNKPAGADGKAWHRMTPPLCVFTCAGR